MDHRKDVDYLSYVNYFHFLYRYATVPQQQVVYLALARSSYEALRLSLIPALPFTPSTHFSVPECTCYHASRLTRVSTLAGCPPS